MFASDLSLHTLMMSLLLVVTPILILFTIGGGLLRRQFSTSALPPVPMFPGATFPNIFDWLYTAFFITTTIFGTVVTVMNPPTGEITVGTLLTNLLLQVCVYLPFVIRFGMLPAPIRPKFRIGTAACHLFLALLSIIIPFCILEQLGFFRWLTELTGCPELQDIVVMFRDGNTELRLVIAAAAVIVAPVCEEIVYRGFVYNILKRYSGRVVAILLSALLFSVIHGSLAQTLPLLVFGVVQCILYDKARSLWLPMALHAIYNALMLIMILILPA